MKRNRTDYIVIHTAAWPGDPSAEEIRRMHMSERGFDDIGYHYVIRKHGRIEAGRPEAQIGAHCRSMEMNYKSIGICLSGDHDTEDMTVDQLQSLASLVNQLRRAYDDIPIENVIGHRETGANKTCPGKLVHMDRLRSYIDEEDIRGVERVDTLETVKLSELDTDHPELKQIDQAEFDGRDFVGPGAGKKNFWHTAFGRTLSARNTTGKWIYGAAGTAASVLTGINIDLLANFLAGNLTGSLLPQINTTMELDIWNIALMAMAAVITFVTSRSLLKGIINDMLIELDDVIGSVQAARKADSPGGKEITDQEKMLILKEADDILVLLWNRIVRSRILKLFGLEQKPEKTKS